MYKLLVFFSFILIFSYLDFVDSTKLPSFINGCYRDDPNLRKCLVKEGRRILKKFVSGVPEVGVETIDPLQLGDFNFVTPTSGIKVSHKKAVIVGFKDMQLLDLNTDMEKLTGELRLKGNLTFKSDYSINGQFLIFPLRGSGDCKMKMINLDLHIKWNWIVEVRNDGNEHTKVTTATNRNRIEGAVIRMDGLFGNDKTLGNAINKMLNENWRAVYDEFGPPAIKVTEKKVISIINNFYASVPFDDLLPRNPTS